MLAFAAFAGNPRAQAQTVLNFNTLYEAQNLTPFGNNINFNYSTNFAWEASASFGSFSEGIFGEEYGAGGSAFVRVGAGFNIGFKADTGTVSVKIPNKIRITSTLTPENEDFGGTISVTQDRNGIGSDSFFTTTAPSFGFNLGFHYELNAGIEGRIAYGVGSASGEISLATLWAAQSAQNAAMYALGISPYKTNLDRLIAFDGATGKAAIFNQEFTVSPAGFAKDISANTVTGINGNNLPTLNRLGRVVINPVTAALAANSNNTFTTTRSVENVLRGELDMLGIVTSAFGLPINPFDLRAPIAGTPIEVSLKLLSMNPHIGVGVKQTLTLAPNTYLNLTSNHDVTYSYVDGNGQTQIVTTQNMAYLLPNDGSASTLRIVQIPEASNWQLYSSISIAPQIRNQLFLTITEGFDIEALKAQIGAYGFNASLGPLLDFDVQTSQDIPIWDQWNPLSGGTLSRIYRNSIPLYGAGVIQQMANVAEGAFVNFTGAAGNYSLNTIAGSLYVSDQSLFQAGNLLVTSTGLLKVESDYAEDSSAVELARLNVDKGGQVRIDPNNTINVSSASPGFVDLNGLMSSGIYAVGGLLHYNGPDILQIGADAEVQLLPSAYTADTSIGYRIQNGDHDALRSLARNDGKLLVAGQTLGVFGPTFLNAGLLTLSNGYDMLVNHQFTNTGSLVVGKDSLLDVESLGFTNLAGLTLSNFKGSFGGPTGGGQLYVDQLGGKFTTLANTTDLTFIGARPTTGTTFLGNGYFTSGSDGDALTAVTTTAGKLTLTNGAEQSFTGNLTNTGTLNLNLSGLNIAGTFFNTGTVNLENYGSINVGGELLFGPNGTLTGNWKLGGTITHHGGGIQKIAEGASVEILGYGLGFVNTDGEYANTWEYFSRLDGALTLQNGASIYTGANLSFGANSLLTLNSGSELFATRLEKWDGTLTIGGGASLRASFLPRDEAGNFNAGTLNLYGLLDQTTIYAAEQIQGLAAGSRINIRSGGSFYSAARGNGFSDFYDLSGTLDLSGGGSLRTNVGLHVSSTGTLIMDGNSNLRITQGGFSIDPSANFQPGGTITLGGGGGGNQTSFLIRDGFTLDKVRLELGDVYMVNNFADVNGSGKVVGLGTWTNTGNILGRGEITGGTLINRGTIDAAGAAAPGEGLRLHNFAAPIQNYGTLGSLLVSSTDPTYKTALHFDGVTVNNLSSISGIGSLAFNSDSRFTNATVNNGAVNVNSTGSLTTENSTFEVDYFTVDGSMLVRNNSTNSIRGQFLVGYTGAITLQGATTEQIVVSLDENNYPTYADQHRTATVLNFAPGSTLENRGTFNLEGGSKVNGVAINNYGRVTFSGTNTLENLNNYGGVVDLLNGASISTTNNFNGAVISGPTNIFSNLGLFHLAGENPTVVANSQATLSFSNHTTLTGGGTIQLGGYDPVIPAYAGGIKPADVTWANSGRGIITAPVNSGYVLTLASQNIWGRGELGQGNLTIENLSGSTIGAYGDGSLLDVSTNFGGFLNEGTLEVGAGATMHIYGGGFNSYANNTLYQGTYNVAGLLKIDAFDFAPPMDLGAKVTLDGFLAKITNSTENAITFDDILASGAFTRLNGTSTFASHSFDPFSNAGFLNAGTGGTINITGGYFANFANTTLTGGRYEATGTIRFDGANIVTNAADITLRGTGRIVDENDQNALRNFATNNGRLALLDNATHTVGAGVTAFTQGGNLIVGAGSTFDFGSATITNQNNARYWVGGTLKGTNSPLANGAAHLTLYGNNASWTTGTNTFLGTVGNGSKLTIAGGKENYFAAGTTITNNGVIEIGSATTQRADGTTLRSGAYAMFGAYQNNNYANIAGGTLRYYGGATDDNTTVTNTFENNFYRGFLVDRLGMFGTLEANGVITFGENAKLDVYGMLTNTVGATSFINNSGDALRGTLKLQGGFDLARAIDTSNINVEFTRTAGSTLRLATGTMFVDAIFMSDTNNGFIHFSNGARLLDRANLDQLRNLRYNPGTMTFDRTDSGAPVNDHTFINGFHNSGTLNVLNSSFFRVTGDLLNTGSINLTGSSLRASGHVTNTSSITGGSVSAGGTLTNTGAIIAGANAGIDLLNGAVGDSATLTGGVSVGRDFINETGSTVSNASSSTVGRNLINYGTLDATFYRVDGAVQNYGTMTTTGNSFRNLAGTAYASVRNEGTLTITGGGSFSSQLFNSGSANAQLFIEGEVGLAGNNASYGGKINVRDEGTLYISNNNQLGSGNVGNILTLESGGRLQLTETSLGTNRLITAQNNTTIQGNFLQPTSTGVNAINGAVEAQGNLTIASSGGGGSARDFTIRVLTMGATGDLTLNNTNLKLGNSTTINGALNGFGSLSFSNHTGESLTLNGGGNLANPASGYTAPAIIMTSSLGTLRLGGVAGTNFLGGIQNAGKTIVTSAGLSIGGILSGTGSLEINSGAALWLNGAQTFTGSTTIKAGGSLTLGDDTSLAGSLTNAGTLIFDTHFSGATVAANRVVSGPGSIVKTGNSLLTILSGDYLKNLTIHAGQVQAGDGGDLSGTFAITNNSDLRFNSSGTIALTLAGTGYTLHEGSGTVSGSVTGSGHVSVDGGGTLALTASNFTGGVSAFSGSTLSLSGTSVLSSLSLADSTLSGGSFDARAFTSYLNGDVTLSNTALQFGAIYNQLTETAKLIVAQNANVSVGNVIGNFAYQVDNGALRFTGNSSNSISGLKVGRHGGVRFSGGINDVTADGDLLGQLTIDSGATVNLTGSVVKSTEATDVPSTSGTVTLHGSLVSRTSNGTFEKITNDLATDGTFTRHFSAGAGTTTVGTLKTGTVNVDSGSLTATDYTATTTNLNANNSGLIVANGITGTLRLENQNGHFIDTTHTFTARTVTVGSPAGTQFYTLQKRGIGTLEVSSGTFGFKFDIAAGTLRAGKDTVFNGVISGAGNFVAFPFNNNDGFGSVTLANDNTYTGGTTLFAGRLIIGNGGSLGSVVGNIDTVAGSTLAFNRGDTTTLANTITGAGALEQAGSGTLVLNSDLGYLVDHDNDSNTPMVSRDRAIAITNGTLQLTDGAAHLGTIANQSALALNNETSDVTVSGVISGTGTVTKDNTGLAILAGDNTYSGATTINEGTLRLTGSNANTRATIGEDGTLALGGNGSIGGTIANAGTLALDLAHNSIFGNAVTGPGLIVKQNANDVYLANTSYTNDIRIDAGQLRTHLAADGTLVARLSGNGTFLQSGAGMLTLTGGTFGSLNRIVVDGPLRLAGGSNWNTDFLINVGSTLSTAYNLSFTRSISGLGSFRIESGRFSLTNGGSLALVNGTTIDAGATLGLFGTATFSGPIVNNGLIDFDSDFTLGSLVTGSGSFFINDNSRVTLTAANTNSGGATIAANSTLTLSGNGATGGTIANSGTLELVTTTGNSRSIPANLTGSGNVSLSGGGTVIVSDVNYTGQTFLTDGTTLNVGTNNTSTFANLITGEGNLITSGLGTVILEKANAFTGSVTVSGGSTLQLGNGGLTGSIVAGNSLLINGTLAFKHNLVVNEAPPVTQLNGFSGAGTIRVMGSGERVVVGSDNAGFTGLVKIDSGATLDLGTGGETGSIGVNAVPQLSALFQVDGTLRLNRSDELTFNHTLSGSGQLQSFAPSLTLNGRLSFAGNVSTSGALTFASSSSSSYLGSFSGASSVTNSGSLTLVGDTDYHGGTFTNTGLLTIGNGTSGAFIGTVANTGSLTFNRNAGTDVSAGAQGGALQITGTGQVIQNGTNVLTIGQNVRAGSFYIHSGVMSFDHPTGGYDNATIDASGSGIARFIEGTFANIINASHLETIGNVTLQNIASAGSLSATGGDLVIARNGSAVDLTLGALSGDASVHYADTGKLTLATGSTHTGALSTSGNFISVGGGLAASRVDFQTAGANTLEFNNTSASSFSSLVTGLTELRKNGAGTLTFDGTFGDHATAPINVGSAITLNVGGGTLDVSSATLNRSLNLQLATGGTLNIGNRGSSVLSLTGTGGSVLGSGNISIDQITYTGALSGFNNLTTQGGQLGSLNGINSLTKNHSTGGDNFLDIQGNASGSGLVKVNAGTVNFYGTADFGGYLDVNEDLGHATAVSFRENATFGTGVFGDAVIRDGATVNFAKNATADYFVVNGGSDLRIGGLATSRDEEEQELNRLPDNTVDDAMGFTVTGNSYLRFGANASLSANSDIFLSASSLVADGTLTFGAGNVLTAVSADVGGITRNASLSGNFVFNTGIEGGAGSRLNFGNGSLTLNGATAYAGTLNINSGGTLVLGSNTFVPLTTPPAPGYDPLETYTGVSFARTNFASGSSLDVNGMNFTRNMANFNGVTFANSGAAAVTISSGITTTSWFGLNGGTNGFTFTGTITGGTALGLYTDGKVAINSSSFNTIGALTVQSGTTSVGLAALNNNSAITLALIGTGALNLNAADTGPGAGTFSKALPFTTSYSANAVHNTVRDTVSFLNNTGAALAVSSAITTASGVNGRYGNALIGGANDVTFTGSVSGELSLIKTGAGTLTFTPTGIGSWNASVGGARLGVREGTLVTSVDVLKDRRLVVENTGVLQISDAASSTLLIHSLEGNGTLALDTRNLEFRGQNYNSGTAITSFIGSVGQFTGALTTSGSVTFNGPTGLTLGPAYLTQTFGTLTASTVNLNAGSLTVLDALSVGSIAFKSGGSAGGILRVTTNRDTTPLGISNAANVTDLKLNLTNTWGTVRLIGGSTLTSNSGSLQLDTAQASILDDDTGASTLGHLTSNTGLINVNPSNGRLTLTQGAANFTNSGSSASIGLSNAEWTGFGTFTNTGSLSLSSLSVLGVTQLNQNGGTFSASGTLRGALAINGGTFNLGGSGSTNTFSVQGGVTVGTGSTFNWKTNNTGATSDLLAITNSPGNTDGKLTFANTNAKLPTVINLQATGFASGITLTEGHTWTFATTTDGVVGANSAGVLVLARNNLGNAVNGAGSFRFETAGNTLNVVYSPHQLLQAGTTYDSPLTIAAGNYGVGMIANGIATLNTANTYAGNTQLTGGTVAVGHDNALSSGYLLANGGTLSSAGGAHTVANNVYLVGTLNLGGSNDLTMNGWMTNVTDSNRSISISNTGKTTLAGNIAITGVPNPLANPIGRTLTVSVAATAGASVVSGVIEDGLLSSNFTKSGSGTLSLTGANTYTGLTTVANATNPPGSVGSTLLIGNGGTTGSILGNVVANVNTTFGFNRSNRYTFAGNISGAGKLVQLGTGLTALTGTNTYTGTTTINAGTLQFGKQVSLYNGNTANWTATNLVVASGATAAFNVGGSGEFTASDLDTIKSLGFASGAFLGLDTTNATGAFTYGSNLTGALGLTKLGTGTLALTGNNTYSGATNVLAGTLQLGSATALSANTTLNVVTGATFDTNGYAQAFASLAGTGAINVGSSGISVAPTTTNTYSGSLTGTGGLTMNGTGTLVLNNSTNNFSGPVTISSGTLEVGTAGALSSGLAVSLTNTATLNLANNSTTVGALTGNGNVTLGSATLTLAPAATESTFSGSISGTGGVTLSGGGTVILTGTSNYSGNTSVNSGLLVVNGSIATSDVTVNSGGTIGGSGAVGALMLSAGSTLAPGNSPGTMNSGATTWTGGANYEWEINDAASPATGAGTRYDLLSISAAIPANGTLTITATAGNKFTLSLVSLLANNNAGDVINFSSAVNSAYTIATTTGGIFGFSSSVFMIDPSDFSNALHGGTWSLALANSSRDLQLNFTAAAIPEPSTYAALAGAFVLGLALYRKRRV